MEKENKLEKNLIVPEKETIFSRFFKWVKTVFGKKQEKIWSQEPVVSQFPNITIPKAVQMPIQMEEPEGIDKNDLEYLAKLSDSELDDLDKLYDEQIEEAKSEMVRLENILQTYKQSIKKMQENLAESET